ncbi:MAG TPA: ABC transporter substrate-binding protein, partial [Acidimicrobiales bacterium]|nr:ABC transporter substrate-binding protein [Acidimicrobiales bacterium]
MKARALVIVLVFSLLAMACADTGREDDGEAQETTSTTTSGEPVRGGTVVAAIDSDPGQLNPAITTSGAVHTASELMFNGLVALSPELEPVPELAESWEVEDDGALYRFQLRDDVTWHDGEPFTSADVKFSFEEVLLEFHSRTKASVGNALESIETPDDHTVEFRFTEPYAPLLQQLDVTEAPIIPRHVYEGTDPQEN